MSLQESRKSPEQPKNYLFTLLINNLAQKTNKNNLLNTDKNYIRPSFALLRLG